MATTTFGGGGTTGDSGRGSRFGTDGGRRYVANKGSEAWRKWLPLILLAAAILLFGLFRGLRRNHEASPSDSTRTNIERHVPWQMPNH